MKYYDKSDRGFHLKPAEGRIEITDEYWQELIESQSDGCEIVPDETGRPVKKDVKQSPEYIALVSKTNRDSFISAPVEYPQESGCLYVIDEEFRRTIQDAPHVGATDETQTNWRLADNNWRITSLRELKVILGLFAMRRLDVWNQFSVWDKGPKTEPFEYIQQ